jgi:glutathione S-transferase
LEWLFLFVTDVIAPNNQGFHLQRALGAALAPEVMQTLNQRSIATYQHLNAHLSERPFIAGEALTIADIAGYTITAALTNLLSWDSLPHVRRWCAALAQRPGFQRGKAAFT